MKTISLFACFIAFAFIPYSQAQSTPVSGTLSDRLQKLEQENLELKKQMLEMQKQIAESLRQNQALLQQNQEVQKQNQTLTQRIISLENCQIKAWSARNTGCVVLDYEHKLGITIPGLFLAFELSEKSLVQIIANGTQLSTTEGNSHIGYCFVIDGKREGDPKWGQRLQMNYVHQGGYQIWTLTDFKEMELGQHTVAVHVRGDGYAAVICGESDKSIRGYTSGTLHVIAIPR